MLRKTNKINFKKYSNFLYILFFALAFLYPLIKSDVALADAPPNQASINGGTYSWVDRNTIKANINGVSYTFRAGNVEGQIGESGYLSYDEENSDCWGRMRFDDNYPFDWVGSSGSDLRPHQTAPRSINVDMDFIDPTSTSSNCQGTDPGSLRVQLLHPNNFNVYFTASDDGRHINAVSGDDNHSYTQSGRYANLFLRDSEEGDSCQDVIQVNRSNGTYKSYELTDSGGGDKAPASLHSGADCKLIEGDGYVKMAVTQKLGNPSALKSTPNPSGPGGPGGGGAAGGDDEEQASDCDTKLLNPLSWIICPVIDIGANGSDYIFQNIVEPLLSDIPLSTDPNNEFFKAWQGFRFIANIILVAGMLGIVYSMARGDK
jgi:hypothetical protein